MSQSTINASSILRPEDVQALVVEPVTQQSVAFQVSTPVPTESKEVRFPILTDDPTAAWVDEGEELNVDDAQFDDLVVTPKKIAAITAVTSELATDSSPEAQAVIGDALVRSLTAKIDSAFFGNTVAHGPNGLKSLAGVQLVLAGSAPSNTDAFLEAISKAEQVGSQLTSWVTDPDTALYLAKLKKLDGSNEPLLTTDAASPTGRVIAGVPLVVSPFVTPKASPAPTIWGIPKTRSFAVIRKDVTIDTDKSAFWTSDRIGVRAIARVAFGWPHEAALVEVRLASPGS
jgi:HK97 family phage major capsid protein